MPRSKVELFAATRQGSPFLPLGAVSRRPSSLRDCSAITCAATRRLVPARSSPTRTAGRYAVAPGGVGFGVRRSSLPACWARSSRRDRSSTGRIGTTKLATSSSPCSVPNLRRSTRLFVRLRAASASMTCGIRTRHSWSRTMCRSMMLRSFSATLARRPRSTSTRTISELDKRVDDLFADFSPTPDPDDDSDAKGDESADAG
jgi:hypothetical protein